MRLLTLIVILFSLNLYAQQIDIFRIDSLPTEGVLLDKGWKWYQGENPDFNKQIGQPINPNSDIRDSIPDAFKSGINTLRLYIQPHPSLKNTMLTLQVKHSVAAIYKLNGVEIGQYGQLSNNPNEVIAQDPYWKAIPFPLKADTVNVFDIQYAVQPNIKYTSVLGTSNPLSSIHVQEAKTAQLTYTEMDRRHTSFFFFLVGSSLITFLIHLTFFVLNLKSKANLYFALSKLVYAIAIVLQYYCFLSAETVGQKFWLGNLALSLLMLNALIANISINYYLRREWDRADKLFVFLYFPIFYVLFFIYPSDWRIGISYQIFFDFILIRKAVLNWKRNKPDSLAIGIGAGLTFILFIFSISIGVLNNDFVNSMTSFRLVLYVLYSQVLPLAVSIILAKEFADNALMLQRKLIENESLTNEKQQILATQNETLEKQVAERTAELKASQAQLIQKEKLASLGELTAGIAHEIQNPLNFVNNFSELSVGIAQDLEEEIKNSPLTPNGGIIIEDKTYFNELISDLTQNQEKINHHGKRASSIVKGMLEHSRQSTGERELTDINQLADEYLRLAYHGLRAKDSRFNCDYQLIADEKLPKVEVVPQEIGRVLLNLINNAFYAVQQKTLTRLENSDNQTLSALEGYQPKVTVTTKTLDNQSDCRAVEIRVADNGTGMSEATKAKIFQPFFTTKPTGEGTGLGLSLAYDIVTKGHGGTIEVESVKGEGTTFTIKLPFSATNSQSR